MKYIYIYIYIRLRPTVRLTRSDGKSGKHVYYSYIKYIILVGLEVNFVFLLHILEKIAYGVCVCVCVCVRARVTVISISGITTRIYEIRMKINLVGQLNAQTHTRSDPSSCCYLQVAAAMFTRVPHYPIPGGDVNVRA